MSCDNSTGPINITNKNTKPCNKTCHLKYKYNITPVIATNKAYYLSLQVNNANAIEVIYSTAGSYGNCNSTGGDYTTSEIRIYHPSLHAYNGAYADAELIIYHKNLIGGTDLIICIPIAINPGTQPSATKQLTQIIEYMTNAGNKSGEGGNIPGLNFNLNDFIPKKKGFYSYTASLPYLPCTNCIEYIVYDLNTASISLTNDVFNKLKTIIKAKKSKIQKLTDDLGYSYNKRGAVYGESKPKDDIWIDCKPTGESGEILIEEKKNLIGSEKEFSLDINNFIDIIKNSTIANIIFGILIVIVAAVIIRYVGKQLFKGGGTTSYTSYTSGGRGRKLNKINL